METNEQNQLRKEFDEYMMSGFRQFTPDNAFEWFELKIIEINKVGSLKTVEQLLDKLDKATDLLKEAKGGSFNSNLGARIEYFLSKETQDSQPLEK